MSETRFTPEQLGLLRDLEAAYERLCQTPSDIHEHLPTLRRYAEQCDHITEFGVRWVVSTIAFLTARKRLVSYDVASHPNIEACLMTAGRAGLAWRFVQASTLEVEIEETDLLFVDTLHTYRQLSQELDLHHGKVRRWILLHDTTTFGEAGEDAMRPGLWRAVQEHIERHGDEWELVHRYQNNNGLTVLGRKGAS